MTKLKTGKITDVSIGKYPGGTDIVRVLTVQATADADIQTVEHVTESGVDSAPVVGDKVLLERVGEGAYKVSQSTGDLIDPTSEPGEYKIYSHSSDAILGSILIDKNGKISLKNDASGNELLDLIDQLLTELQKTVDLGGTASTGTLFKINPALAEIQTKLATIKA